MSSTGSGALFSECGAYRWHLWRRWDWSSRGPAVFVMLNPSTADASTNDPTVERCQRRAAALGYRALEVVNLFALRSTDPRALLVHPDPVGPECDRWIAHAVRGAGLVVVAWGSHRAVGHRGRAVLAMIRELGKVPHALALNRDGNPAHPLYQPYGAEPRPMPDDWQA